MRDTDSRPPLRELPARFSLPLIGDTLAFVRDPAGFLQRRARELGPAFRIDVFRAPTACFAQAALLGRTSGGFFYSAYSFFAPRRPHPLRRGRSHRRQDAPAAPAQPPGP